VVSVDERNAKRARVDARSKGHRLVANNWSVSAIQSADRNTLKPFSRRAATAKKYDVR
jgi:hypothetical protein